MKPYSESCDQETHHDGIKQWLEEANLNNTRTYCKH